jgi:hypothetical protein
MAGYDNTKLVLRNSDLEGNAGGQLWGYTTAADSDATITGANYFSDGVKKGMKVGDLVDVIGTTGPKYKRYQVASLGTAAATVAAPTAIT